MESLKPILSTLLDLVAAAANSAKIVIAAVFHWPWTPVITVFVLLVVPT